MSAVAINDALLEACCRAALDAQKLDADTVIRHPYSRLGEERRPRWKWLADPAISPEVTAIIQTVLQWRGAAGGDNG